MMSEKTDQQKKADKFVAAVAAGAKVFAHPDTARLMREFLGEIEDCQWLESGELYAVNFGRFKLFDDPRNALEKCRELGA